MATKLNVTGILAILVEAFQTLRATPETLAVWERVLRNLGNEEAVWAAYKVCEHHTHGPPAPSHLLQWVHGRRRTVSENVTNGFLDVIRTDRRDVREFPDGVQVEMRHAHPELEAAVGEDAARALLPAAPADAVWKETLRESFPDDEGDVDQYRARVITHFESVAQAEGADG